MEITQRLKEIIKQETNTDIDIRTRKRETVELRSLYCNVLKELKPNKRNVNLLETAYYVNNLHPSLQMYSLNACLRTRRVDFIKVDSTTD